MKSYTPLSVAMRIFDKSGDENKVIEDYVDQYVEKLSIWFRRFSDVYAHLMGYLLILE